MSRIVHDKCYTFHWNCVDFVKKKTNQWGLFIPPPFIATPFPSLIKFHLFFDLPLNLDSRLRIISGYHPHYYRILHFSSYHTFSTDFEELYLLSNNIYVNVLKWNNQKLQKDNISKNMNIGFLTWTCKEDECLRF